MSKATKRTAPEQGSASAYAKLQKTSAAVGESAHTWVMTRINEELANEPAKANRVLVWIMSGGADEKKGPEDGAADAEMLSSSTNKFRLLRRDVQVRLLSALDADAAACLEGQTGKFTELVCFALHLDSQSAIYSKRVGRMIDLAKARYEEKGKRLQGKKLEGVGAKGEFWNTNGYFSLVFDGSKDLKKVRYIGGEEVEVTPERQTDGWELQSNWSFKDAVIAKGMMHIKRASFFEKNNVKLDPPLKLTEAAEPAHSPSTPVTSPAGSTPRAQRYGLMSPADASPPPPPGPGGALDNDAST